MFLFNLLVFVDLFWCSFILHVFIYIFLPILQVVDAVELLWMMYWLICYRIWRRACLGYEIHPSIYFAVAVEGNFHPTANFCINLLTLERVDDISQKFPDNLLTIFGYVFVNTYYGNISEWKNTSLLIEFVRFLISGVFRIPSNIRLGSLRQ